MWMMEERTWSQPLFFSILSRRDEFVSAKERIRRLERTAPCKSGRAWCWQRHLNEFASRISGDPKQRKNAQGRTGEHRSVVVVGGELDVVLLASESRVLIRSLGSHRV